MEPERSYHLLVVFWLIAVFNIKELFGSKLSRYNWRNPTYAAILMCIVGEILYWVTRLLLRYGF